MDRDDGEKDKVSLEVKGNVMASKVEMTPVLFLLLYDRFQSFEGDHFGIYLEGFAKREEFNRIENLTL